ncbi:hypothetical protein ACWEWI_18220 [Streptomyces sp. NPDC003753]
MSMAADAVDARASRHLRDAVIIFTLLDFCLGPARSVGRHQDLNT